MLLVTLCLIVGFLPPVVPSQIAQIQALSYRLSALETLFFQRFSALETRLNETLQILNFVSEKITSASNDSGLAEQDLEAIRRFVSGDNTDIQKSIITEGLEHKHLEEMLAEIKGSIETTKAEELTHILKTTAALERRLETIEECRRVTNTPQRDNKTTQLHGQESKDMDHRNGPRFTGQPLNANANKTANDCADLFEMGYKTNGVYRINRARGKSALVECYMEELPNIVVRGWTVVQRRSSGLIDFNRTWEEYKRGFGDFGSEFWLGNDFLWEALNSSTEGPLLRLKLNSPRGIYYSEYRFFITGGLKMADEENLYKLDFNSYSYTQETTYQGPAKGVFMTWDKQNLPENCPPVEGGWWYNNYGYPACEYRSRNLNSKYSSLVSQGIHFRGYVNTYIDSRSQQTKAFPIGKSELLVYFRKDGVV